MIAQMRKDSKRAFVYLDRQVDSDVAAKAKALKIPGVGFVTESKRYYPQGETMAHLVGFTSIEDKGQEGVELAFNDRLTGEDGERNVLRDRLGNVIEDIRELRPPVNGQDLVLSVDADVQYIVLSELKKAVEQHKARAAAAVVLDAKTGELLAMANIPTYDPNNRGQLHGEKLRNRVFTDMFEPGSTLKPFGVALAMDQGKVKAMAGRVRPWNKWRPIEQATMSYGHGISVSLIQLAQSYTIFANKGHFVPASLIKRGPQDPVVSHRVISEKVADSMLHMLELASGPEGTAIKAQVQGYRVAGKTGTAHKQEGGRYVNKYVSSYVGLAPVSDPRVIVAIMVDEPKSGVYFGGLVAAPVFSTITKSVLTHDLLTEQRCGLVLVDYDDQRAYQSASVLPVLHLKTMLADLAFGYYETPSDAMTIIAVTGTNGKTTVTRWLAQSLNQLGKKAAVIGTLGYGEPDQLKAHTGLTTPDVVGVHHLLHELRQAGFDTEKGQRIELKINGAITRIDTPIIGEFNADNMALVFATLVRLGYDASEVKRALAAVTPAPGRMQHIEGEPAVVVDYAHTPDALEKTLLALRPFANKRMGKLWVVFGCGGDRDRSKRPLMGAAAVAKADFVVLTSDNPRTSEVRMLELNWAFEHIATALSKLLIAQVNQGVPELPSAVRLIQTDSRLVEKGDLFVCLIGERFDAHDFAGQVMKSGAAALQWKDNQ
eukprot:gene34316-biopygen8129